MKHENKNNINSSNIKVGGDFQVGDTINNYASPEYSETSTIPIDIIKKQQLGYSSI